MKKTALIPVLIALAALLGLPACVSLASDITPPPDYTPPAVQAVSNSPAFPLVAPDPAAGAPIYAEKCAPCHGDQGLGDGPDAAKLSVPVAAIGQPDVARASTPSDWYNVITTGRLERFMPGFTGSLNDRQRWDVLAYVYTLSTPEEQLAAGREVYQAECASCHGESGRGDGPQAASLSTKVESLVDQSILAQKSLQDLYDVTHDGAGEMPAYAGTLNELQIWAVSAHLRSLTFAGSGAAVASAPQATATQAATQAGAAASAAVTGTPAASKTAPAGTASPEAAQGTETALTPDAPQTVNITGKVVSASQQLLPEGLTVSLLGYDGMNNTLTLESPVAADGSYSFENVEVLPERVFLTTVEYKGAVFNSDIAHAQDINGPVDLPIMVFESTSDASALSVDRMHLFFDFSNPGLVQVVELLIVSNTGDSVVVPTAEGQPVLTVDLPQGYSNLQFDGGALGERFVQTPNGFGDLSSIAPGGGQHQVLFAYELPYERKLDVSMPLSMPVNAAIVMVPTNGVKLSSQQLTASGTRDVQGLSFNSYTGENLTAGTSLDMTLSGKPRAEGAATSNTTQNLIIGGGVLGLVLLGTGLWLYRSRGKDDEAEGEEAAGETAEDEAADADTLIEAIAALDDQHSAGNISEAAYQERRAELKARLRDLMNQQPPENGE